jgi:spore germination protein GerM
MALAACLVAGCGVPTQSAPQTIPRAQVPFHLLDPEAPTTTTTAPAPPFTVPVLIYLVSSTGQNLVSSQRLVAPPAQLSAVLDALLAGPTAGEAALGTQTAISSGVRVLGASVNDGVATVNFNSAFGEISGPQQILAVAQVVFTVTSQLSPETGVTFEIGGTPTNVPIATGAQVPGPVHLLQYVALAPPPPGSPASTTPAPPGAGAPGATTTTNPAP